MSKVETSVKKLAAGEHYGAVFHKRRTDTAVFSESVYQRSMALPEHSHELGFFTLIMDGYYSEMLGSKTVVYSPQTVLWRAAELSHRDRIEAASSRFFFVEIQRSFADRWRECEQIPDHVAEKNGELTWLASRLRAEIISSDTSSPLIAEGITLEMIGNLTRKRGDIEKRAPKWLGRVIHRLDEEFAEPITSESLAADAGVHPVHLASVFRKFQHETIGDYVQKRRVEYASGLLLNPEMPLTDIALACGFSDQSHFTRVFKRRVGMTPGAFRNSLL
jgi:AraC family transcriptional regulator